jgi:hypothetical protein
MLKQFYLMVAIISLILICLLVSCKEKVPDQLEEPQVEVLKSSPEGMELRVHIPSFKMFEVKTEAGNFQRISPPNVKQHLLLGGFENVSLPEVPIYAIQIALPLGGEAEIVIEPEGESITQQVRLYPVQPEERNRTDVTDTVVFVFDKEKYIKKQIRVKDVVSFRPLQQVGVNIYKLSFNLVDYDPSNEMLTSYPSLKVKIEFKGNLECFRIVPQDSGRFQMDQIDSFFERFNFPIADNLLNTELLWKYTCLSEIKPVFMGTRFLIITHPDFLSASQNLRTHKISLGISTAVVTTQTISNDFGDGSGVVTDIQIKNFMKNYYNGAFIKPKWVLLMGDAEFIPTHYTNQQNFWDNALNAGDQFYGQLDDNDLSIPTFGIGRLPVDMDEQAQTIVDKIIAYENNPPSRFNTYYSDLSFAAQFQDNEPDNTANRWFAETSEHIRDYLLTVPLSIERIYRTSPDSDPTYWNDGTMIPAELQRPTFGWDGSTTDIINATNDGTSILYHRNHGWWDGWGTPSFRIADLASVSIVGNEFPVVFSINCASGIFDNETVDLPANIVGGGYGPNTGSVYWAETFIRKSDGAIGVIGDTRSSSTTANNTMAKGLFDAIFPAYDSFGGSSSIRKLGDVLNHAKSYISASGYSDASVKQENTIYNLLGDPTISVRTQRYWYVILDDIITKLDLELLEIRIRHIEPKCLSCPPLDPIFREKTRLVAQDPKSGRVIGRGVVDEEGVVRLRLGDYRGELTLTFSSADVITTRHIFVVR